MATTWDLRRLQQHLERKKPASLYFITGEDQFLVDESLKTIKSRCVDPVTADFNFDSFYAPEANATQVKDVVELLPMMSERRLVIYKNVHGLKEKDWDSLDSLLEDPIDSTTLVLVADKVDKRKKFYKRILKTGVVVELKKPYDNQVPTWIDYIAHINGIQLSRSANEMIHQLVGTNLSEVNNELKKLAQYLGDKKNADVDDVLKVVSKARIDSIFDLTDAIGRRDKVSALTFLASLLEQGQSEVAALALILRHIRILSQIKEGQKLGMSTQKLCTKLGIPNFFMRKYLEQCKAWTDAKISKTILVLHETDKAIKSSPVSSHIWLENFIIKTC